MTGPEVEVVVRAVEGILDAGPLAEEYRVPSELCRISRLRSAARRILESGLVEDEKIGLLGGLSPIVRTLGPYADLAAAAIEAEIAGPPDDGLPVLDRSLEERARRLRDAGYERCPLCSTQLLQLLALDISERRRTFHARTEAAWRQAARFAYGRVV